jgi:hypothetical protein
MQLVDLLRHNIVRSGLLLIVIAAALTGCSDSWSRSQIDLERFTGDAVEGYKPFENAYDSTAEVCPEIDGCVQAVTSDHLILIKFSSDDGAKTYAESVGESAVQIDPLVVDFTGSDLSTSEQDDAVKAVAGVNSSSPD